MANIQRMTRKKLGEILLQAGVIDDLELQTALTEQAQSGELLGEILVRRGFATETDIVRTIATQFSLPYLSASQVEIASEVMNLVPLDLMRRHQMVPLDRFGNCLTVLIAGMLSAEALAAMEKSSGCEIQLVAGRASDVKELISRIELEVEEPAPADTGERPAGPASARTAVSP